MAVLPRLGAADLLIEQDGKLGILDFFRNLVPGRVCPAGAWDTQLSWQSARSSAFGQLADQFYTEFETAMAKRRGSAPRRPQANELRLRGRVLEVNREPRAGVWSKASQYQDEQPAG
ncbi:MAG: hypothetical protein OXH38_04210 [Chloroflexi bacterium]|nr:hypothetical protein [Chloroflexota bacterium]